MPDNTAEVVITARYEDQAKPGIDRLQEDMRNLGASAESLAPLEESLNRTSETLESFRSQYAEVMDDLAGITRTALEHFVAGSFMAVAKAMSAWIAGAKGGAQEFAKAMLMLSAQAVLAIGQQAAVKAIFALAEFFLFKDPMSLVAAKLYGSVAAMALVTGAALMGATSNAGGAGAEGGGGGGSGAGAFAGGGVGGAKSQMESELPGNQFIVNVHVQGHVVDSQAFVEDVVAPALAQAVGRGVAGRSKYNLVTQRD